MERYRLAEDVRLYCVQASSFPAGILAAFNRLENIFTDVPLRDCFGISYMNEDGDIIYKAAIAASHIENSHGCEEFTLVQGEYLTTTIKNWRQNVPAIGQTFKTLIADARMDKTFPCVEWYENEEDVICMVKIDEAQIDMLEIDTVTGLINN